MVGVAMLRGLAAAAVLVAVAHGQTVGSALTGQSGASFPGACPISKLSDVIVTTIATLPESTTGPITLAYSAASNYPFGQPTMGFITSPTWNLFLNNTATYFSTTNNVISGLKFFGECKQNLLTLQATCSFVFDYSTRRLLDLLSKATPAGGIPLGGTVNFQFCSLALGESQVSSPTCFESRGGAPKPVIVKISSKEAADVIPPIGFNACYKDAVGSPYKCLSFAIVQSCADSSQVTPSGPPSPPIVYTPGPGSPTSNGAAINGPISGISSNFPAGSSGAAVTNIQPPSGPSAGGAAMTSIGSSARTAATVPAPAGNAGTQTRSQQIYQQGAQAVMQQADSQARQGSQQQQGRRLLD